MAPFGPMIESRFLRLAELVAQLEVRNLLADLGTKFGHNDRLPFGRFIRILAITATPANASRPASVAIKCNDKFFIGSILVSCSAPDYLACHSVRATHASPLRCRN